MKLIKQSFLAAAKHVTKNILFEPPKMNFLGLWSLLVNLFNILLLLVEDRWDVVVTVANVGVFIATVVLLYLSVGICRNSRGSLKRWCVRRSKRLLYLAFIVLELGLSDFCCYQLSEFFCLGYLRLVYQTIDYVAKRKLREENTNDKDFINAKKVVFCIQRLIVPSTVLDY